MDTETSLASIRAALAPDATNDARNAGAEACRAVLAVLDSSPVQQSGIAPINAAMFANALTALRSVPRDHLLDLAISKLRAMLPTDASLSTATPLKLHLIPVPNRAIQ
jgi:hypothetical protein